MTVDGVDRAERGARSPADTMALDLVCVLSTEHLNVKSIKPSPALVCSMLGG